MDVLRMDRGCDVTSTCQFIFPLNPLTFLTGPSAAPAAAAVAAAAELLKIELGARTIWFGVGESSQSDSDDTLCYYVH